TPSPSRPTPSPTTATTKSREPETHFSSDGADTHGPHCYTYFFLSRREKKQNKSRCKECVNMYCKTLIGFHFLSIELKQLPPS
ncbi:hypothetical protein COCMIDRAFT_101755, partial [Bipolaris oryzae ATCC 44560]